MEKLYWILEYAKVFFAYFFVTFVWPMVVFRKFLKGKSRTFRFAFCVGPQILLINTVVLLMGLIKILNPTTFKIVFWGTFAVSLFWNFRPGKKSVLRFKNFFSGTYGVKSAITDIFGSLGRLIKNLFNGFLDFMKGRWFEFILLFLIIVYSIIYFSYGSFYDNSYGTGDLYTHNMWTYDLCNGQIFSHGVYPEGMHCFIGAEHMAFGIDLYSLILFTAGIHISVIIISMYIFLKNLFSWKYSAQIVLVLYFIIDVVNVDAVFSYCRYQWTLPQEFGYPALFMCATYLIKFLRKKYSEDDLKAKKFWKNEELFIFAATLATTLAVHFYITIMAFLICVPIAVVLIKELISKKFMPLFISVIAGVLIAIVPMATAFATGTRLEGSLYWAMSIISPDDNDEQVSTTSTGSEEEKDTEATEEALNAAYGELAETMVNTPMLTASAQTVGSFVVLGGVSNVFGEFYRRGFLLPFGEERGKLLFIFFIAAILIWAAGFAFRIVRKRLDRDDLSENRWFDGYLVLIGIAAVYSIMLALRTIGLPVIIEETRLFPVQALFVYALIAVAIDFIYALFADKIPETLSACCGVGGILATIFIVVSSGSYHGYLMCQLTRYNQAVNITQSIKSQMKPESYTIVSSTDEIYQFIGDGYHEELISFVNQAEVISYKLPTDYVYLLIEKKPLKRNQYNCYSGPGWLAEEKYQDTFGSGYSSFGRDIKHETITEDMADIYFGPFPDSSNVYAVLWQRTALMAKVYVWCQKFNEMYPNDLHVYYEDDDYVCYYFEQNSRNLYELAVMDSSAMIKPSEYPKPFWPANTFSN